MEMKILISFFGAAFPESITGKLNAINRRIKKIGKLSSESTRDRIFRMYSWGDEQDINRLFKEYMNSKYKEKLLKLYDSEKDIDIVETMMKIDHHYDLMSLNLCYTDRMSMANGVEARVPYLDFDLVELAGHIPESIKMKSGTAKRF